MFDYLIIGAGFSGSILAERLASQANASILLVDRRPHTGGNAYDFYNDHGILVHKYGPHIFHTNSKKVFDYLSRFTAWRPYEHRVQSSVDGHLVPMPINLDTLNKLYGMNLNCLQMEEFLKSVAEPREKIITSEDVVIGRVGRDLYEKFFRNYTKKQWDLDPSELDASVAARVPVRTSRDDRYFTDRYQAMPLHGYTRMFENMLDHPNIRIMLNTDYRDIKEEISFRELIFTGPIDEYFDYCLGKLPYRSVRFEHQTHNCAKFQAVPVVNYPNEHPYTRVTEFKYLTGQEHPKTSIVYEYPCADGDPYYPVPQPKNGELYQRYRALAEMVPAVHFAGRLGTYKYYNMDQVVAQSLTLFEKLRKAQPQASREQQLETVITHEDQDGVNARSHNEDRAA
jgi:UDP-galactopyranose mutase